MYLIVKKYGTEQRQELPNLRWWLEAVNDNILQVFRCKDGRFEQLFSRDEIPPGGSGRCVVRVADWREVTLAWR